MSDERPGWHRHPNGGGWVQDTATVDETAPPPVPPWPDGVLRDAANRLRWIANSGYIEDPGIKRIIRSWADELDATLVPPWPGAVLSGLVDEDGVPTWLAQAGQVRGEQVRGWRDMAWYRPDGHTSDAWVEVRAPRAVPAALVTVTIPAETAHALLRYIEDGDYDTDYVIDRLADLLIAAMDGDQ